MRQELGREGNKARYGSEQATEFADSGDNQRDSNPAKSSSFGPVEDISEDKMNRVQDVITESEKIKKLEERLNQLEEEKEMTKKENHILKEKTQPELLKELQEKFCDEPRLLWILIKGQSEWNCGARNYKALHKKLLSIVVQFGNCCF